MNERIRQLADEANELDYETFDQYNHKTVRHYKFNKEKFAELIIRECARIGELKEQGASGFDAGGNHVPVYNPDISVGWYMRKHFGFD